MTKKRTFCKKSSLFYFINLLDLLNLGNVAGKGKKKVTNCFYVNRAFTQSTKAWGGKGIKIF